MKWRREHRRFKYNILTRNAKREDRGDKLPWNDQTDTFSEKGTLPPLLNNLIHELHFQGE